MAVSPNWFGVANIIAEVEATGVTLGVSIIPPSGAHFAHNADRRFVAASTAKIGIMIELFHQIDTGKLSLDQIRPFRAADVTGGSGVVMNLHEGLNLTLGDLVYLMMSISDNAATNMLIETVGQDAVNATMHSLGMTDSKLGRLMRGRPMIAGEQENWAVPGEYAAIIAALLAKRVVSPSACDQMIALLETQQNNRRIARHLPRAGGPRWGSKTGSLPGVVNDAGFIMTGHGPLCLAVFCEHTDPLAGEETIGAISRAALAAAG